MRSAFFGLHVATSAMQAARGNLHTVAHNVANVITPGFSRQVAVQQAGNPLRAGFGRGMVGTGSEIIAITQIRNSFLDGKFRNQNAVLGQFSMKADILSLTMGILRDTPDQRIGLTSEINDVFARISDLTTNAGEGAYRRNLLSSFESKVTFINNQFSQLTRQMVDINQEIRATVGEINSLGRQITALNRQITVMELDGSNANDLRDQRNLLLDRLSRFVNIDVREIERNPEVAAGRETDPRESRRQLVVLIDGVEFINHFHMQELDVVQRTSAGGAHNILRNPEEPPRMYDIVWRGGQAFNMYSPSFSGELAALINLRDGNGGNMTRIANQSIITTTGPNAFPVDSRINIQFDNFTRLDIGHTGVITARNPTTGQLVQIRYHGREYTPPGVFPPTGANLVLYPPDIPAGFDAANIGNWNLTIGETTNYMGIPYFKARLNELARTLARAFNEGRHLMSGQDIDGLSGGHIHGFDLEGRPGQILFSFVDGQGRSMVDGHPDFDIDSFNYFNITATNFIINPAILRDVSLFAASGDPTDVPDGYHIIMGWSEFLAEDRSLFREGRLLDFLGSITGDLGITARQAVNFARSYNDLVSAIDNQRHAISGVDLEEESVDMIRHQLVFNAAARLLTIIDSIYDTTINRMGNW